MQDKEFATILQDEPMQPLALVPLTEEEQVSHTHPHSYTDTLIPTNVELFQLVMWYLTVIQPLLQSQAFNWLTNVAAS